MTTVLCVQVDIRKLQGTIEFMSPEVMNCKKASTSADMWSVGVVTYMLLTGGKSPFYDGSRLVTLNLSSPGQEHPGKCHSIKRSFSSHDSVTDRESHFKMGNISISSLRIHNRYTLNIIMFSNDREFLAKYVSS